METLKRTRWVQYSQPWYIQKIVLSILQHYMLRPLQQHCPNDCPGSKSWCLGSWRRVGGSAVWPLTRHTPFRETSTEREGMSVLSVVVLWNILQTSDHLGTFVIWPPVGAGSTQPDRTDWFCLWHHYNPIQANNSDNNWNDKQKLSLVSSIVLILLHHQKTWYADVAYKIEQGLKWKN